MMIKKILYKLFLVLLYIVLFFLLSIGTMILYPYVTSETYKREAEVNDLFPIVIKANNHVNIIRWSEYKNNKEKFYSKIFIPAVKTKETYNIETESKYFSPTIVLKKTNNVIKLKFIDDDYHWYSEYSVSDDGVNPLYFRYNGYFVGILAFFISLFGTPVVYFVIKHYLINRINFTVRK